VRLNVEFTLAPAPDEERGAVAGTVSESIKPDRRDKREYEYLEAFREIQPKTRTGSGKPVGGIIFPEEGGKIQLMTWSTGTLDVHKESNTTHAERQFEEWLETMWKD